mgnify:CR=1 FL=1|jgi:integrase
MALTNIKVKTAKPKDRDYKLSDSGGLYLLVKKTGSKYWRLKYRFAGKEKMLALGVYGPNRSNVTLSHARIAREDAKQLLAKNIDPGLERKKQKIARRINADNTFQEIGLDWVAIRSEKWSERHASDVAWTLEKDIFPYVGGIPINDIDTQLLRPVIDRVQNRGALETASRLRQRCSAIFRHGMALGVCTSDPAENLKTVMLSRPSKNLPSLSEEEFPIFLRKLNSYMAENQTMLALRLMALTFVRTEELIGGRWEEINFNQKIWNIPPERMKRSKPHYVPLAKQTLVVLNELHAITGQGELMLPKRGMIRETKSMSNGTILRVIDRIGYRNRMSGHGFRSVASTALNESGLFNFDAIERQLSHEEENEVRAAYNKARYMPERREMMQWWADHLDQLATDAEVIDLDSSKIKTSV